jgi:hypothetical protein
MTSKGPNHEAISWICCQFILDGNEASSTFKVSEGCNPRLRIEVGVDRRVENIRVVCGRHPDVMRDVSTTQMARAAAAAAAGYD